MFSLMQKFLFALLLAATGALMCGLFSLAYIDDLAGHRSLRALSPIVVALVETQRPFMSDLRLFVAGCAAVSIGLVCVLAALDRGASHVLFFLGLGVSLATQFILIDEQTRLVASSLFGLPATPIMAVRMAIWLGGVGYALSFLLLFLAGSRVAAPDLGAIRSRTESYGWGTWLALVAIVVVGSFFRTYGLNHHTNIFEGELAPYSAGATSLSGMVYANRGFNGPWAPLGLLYYLPIYLTTSVFGTTLLALRLSSALVGILTIPLIFLLANRVAGRTAGVFAAALFALNCLHIGWSRTDIHPHGVTTWPTLLMCLFLLKAVETRKIGWALAVALMMGLSWHQYPSGQSAVAIPLIAIAFSWLVNRFTLPIGRGQLVIIALGVGLWVLGLPMSYYPVDGQFKFLNPFTLTGPRALWGTDEVIPSAWQVAQLVVLKSLSHLWDFTQGVFYKVPYLFHQEWLPYTQPLLSRSVPWFVVSLAMTATALLLAQRKRFETAVLFAWLVAGLLPGILSSHAYPKRLSTVFPLIDVVAGVGLAYACEYLYRCRARVGRYIVAVLSVAAIAALTMYGNFVWFSQTFFRFGEPPEVAMARELEKSVGPKTLVISGLGGGYEPGKFLYLMLDHLTNPAYRPNLYVLVSNDELLALLKRGTLDPSQIAISLPYKWTKLDRQLSESLSTTDWEQVTFMIIETLHNSATNSEAVALASSLCANPTVRHVQSSANTPQWAMLTVAAITCNVSEMTTPIVVLTKST
jgi:hypothetical protein